MRPQLSQHDLRRRVGNRAQLERVLIVCEGSKTEPSYFKDLRTDLRINTANCVIRGDCGNTPAAVVAFAIELFDNDKDFDAVFCVFDRDNHPSYPSAIDRVRRKKLRKYASGELAQFFAITSVPSFEYWLLLHFEDTTRPYTSSGRRSAAENLIRDLEKYIPGYNKGMAGIYARTKSTLDTALIRAERMAQLGFDEPPTKVQEVVRYLQRIGRLC